MTPVTQPAADSLDPTVGKRRRQLTTTLAAGRLSVLLGEPHISDAPQLT